MHIPDFRMNKLDSQFRVQSYLGVRSAQVTCVNICNTLKVCALAFLTRKAVRTRFMVRLQCSWVRNSRFLLRPKLASLPVHPEIWGVHFFVFCAIASVT